MASPTFGKEERIVSKKLIETLFDGSESLSALAFPLRVVYMQTERKQGDEPVRILISVPKKRFKHAVDRNRVKRQIREAYRQNKQLLRELVPEDKCFYLAFIWLSDKHYKSEEITERCISLLQKIAKRI